MRHNGRVATEIAEFFGYRAADTSAAAVAAEATAHCPFINGRCTKVLRDGLIAGVCALKPAKADPVICCPNRLYANNYAFLQEISDMVFTPGLTLKAGAKARTAARRAGAPTVAVFGKRWGGELRLPQRSGTGSYFVDWILAHLDSRGDLVEFVAIEVQTIDTTGNYRNGIDAMVQSRQSARTTAGFNWENVSKRIIPQVLYKGNVLQREAKCRGGLFFVTPQPVYDRIMTRLGGGAGLLPYPLQSSSVTFMAYDLDLASATPGQPVPLTRTSLFTTNIGQVAQAFAGPGVMPPANSYEGAIIDALS